MSANTEEAPVDRRPAVDRQIRRVLWITLAANIVAAGTKVLYGRFSGSLSISADGLHSSTDALNNVALLVALRLAARPPDETHPYGHRRVEALASLGIAAAMFLLATSVIRDAYDRLQGSAVAPDLGLEALAVLAVTLGISVGVSTYQLRAGRRLGSMVLEADARHTRSDVWVSLGVIVAVVATRAGFSLADPICAVLVAGLIAAAGVSVLRPAVSSLMDKAPLDPASVEAVARAVDGVVDVHHVRSRGTSSAMFVDLHVLLPPQVPLAIAHEVGHRVDRAIRERYPDVVDVVTHVEPATEAERTGQGLNEEHLPRPTSTRPG